MVVPVPVREVMVHDIVSVSPGTPMSEAIEQLRSHDIGSVVVEDDGAVVGIRTDADLVEVVLVDPLPTDEATPVEASAEP